MSAQLASDLKPHALATIVPDMLTDEYIALVANIKENGLQQPITLFEGQVLDGRHRLRACIEANVPICAVEFHGTREEAKAHVLSLNYYRRHLSYEQKQQIVADELKHDPAQSDRAIAKKAKVGHQTVGRARAKMDAASNGPLDHKPERTEASGRKARGQKPGVHPMHPAQTKTTAEGTAIAVGRVAPSTGTAARTADSQSPGEISSAINKKSAETLETSPATEARSVASVANADSVKAIMDSVRDTLPLAAVAMIAATCVTRLLAERLPSHILRRSGLNAAATDLKVATPKLRRRTS